MRDIQKEKIEEQLDALNSIVKTEIFFIIKIGGVLMEKKGMPGNRGAEHFGFTVPNLKEAVDFFENIIGADVVYEIGPFASDDNWLGDHLNVHPRSVMFVVC